MNLPTVLKEFQHSKSARSQAV